MTVVSGYRFLRKTKYSMAELRTENRTGLQIDVPPGEGSDRAFTCNEFFFSLEFSVLFQIAFGNGIIFFLVLVPWISS